MATKRKSATKTTAREKARSAAASRIERERKVLAAAESFFAKTLQHETKREEIREKISQLQEQLRSMNKIIPEAVDDVLAMKNHGLKNTEIAELLDLSPGEVSAYLKPKTTAQESQPVATVNTAGDETNG